jgi:predicted house-cleaning noncanonical NTP pyrophosphatase (MazG superfamily)
MVVAQTLDQAVTVVLAAELLNELVHMVVQINQNQLAAIMEICQHMVTMVLVDLTVVAVEPVLLQMVVTVEPENNG